MNYAQKPFDHFACEYYFYLFSYRLRYTCMSVPVLYFSRAQLSVTGAGYILRPLCAYWMKCNAHKWICLWFYPRESLSNLERCRKRCEIGIAPIWRTPDSKVHGANMGPTWVLSAPDGPHVGPMNLVIRDGLTKDGQMDKHYFCRFRSALRWEWMEENTGRLQPWPMATLMW